jgi:hypothetical protein
MLNFWSLLVASVYFVKATNRYKIPLSFFCRRLGQNFRLLRPLPNPGKIKIENGKNLNTFSQYALF